MYRPRDTMTPLDKLARLPAAAAFLREGITLLDLQQLARALTDVQAAEESDSRPVNDGLDVPAGIARREKRLGPRPDSEYLPCGRRAAGGRVGPR